MLTHLPLMAHTSMKHITISQEVMIKSYLNCVALTFSTFNSLNILEDISYICGTIDSLVFNVW